MSPSAVPPTCKAFCIPTTLGGLKELVLRDVPVPDLREHEVLVKVRAVSLNYRDIHLLSGASPTKYDADYLIPVSDMAGEVVSVGSAVTKTVVGERVIATFNPNWLAGDVPSEADLLHVQGSDFGGCLVQYRSYREDALVHIPDSMSFEEACTLPIAGMTVHEILFNGPYKLQAGDVVVWPGTGGVSLLGAQLTLAAGAVPIVTSSSDAKLQAVKEELQAVEEELQAVKEELQAVKEELQAVKALGVQHAVKALGVQHAVNYKSTPAWEEEVLKITNGRGADHVVHCTGIADLHKSLKAVRIGGQVHMLGLLGEQQNPALATLAAQIIFKKAIIRGIIIGPKTQCEDIVRIVATTGVKPSVGRVFPFEQALDAFALLEQQEHVGKVVVRVCED